jgi:hypothetical protein
MAKATAKTLTRKATSRTTKRSERSYKELRACIRVTIMEHLSMGAKEINVRYHEYDTWLGIGRKLIFKSKAGEDIIRSGSSKSMLSTNGFFVTDDLPALPQDPIGMVERVARKMGLKVSSKGQKELIIKK